MVVKYNYFLRNVMRSFEKLEVRFQLIRTSIVFLKSIGHYRFKTSENLHHTFIKLKLLVIENVGLTTVSLHRWD